MKVRCTSLTVSVIALFLSAFFLSCSDESEIRPKTISDVIQQDDRFTILRAVLKQAGMSDALRTGNFTFFAPNDDGFRKMSINDPGQVGRMTRDSPAFHNSVSDPGRCSRIGILPAGNQIPGQGF